MTDIVESCKELADNDILIHTQDWSIICHTLRNAAAEIERLREFAGYVLHNGAWEGEMDGGEIQDRAEELGLIELRPCKPEDSIDGETEHYFTKWAPHD